MIYKPGDILRIKKCKHPHYVKVLRVFPDRLLCSVSLLNRSYETTLRFDEVERRD